MVRLKPGQLRSSATTRRADLPERPAGRRGSDSAAALLRAVLDHGPVARSNLARLAGLSPASVSGVTGALIERGLIREVPEAAGPPGFGRPHVPLDLDPDAVALVGVHVAVPHATVAVLDLRGRVMAQRRVSYDAPAPAQVVELVADELAVFREEFADRRILGVGVASGGRVDRASGVVVEHTVLDWRNVPLREQFEARTGLPTYVESHGRALLRAEQLFGRHAVRARESIVHVFVGNVVDAAFSIRGRVHQGSRSASGTVAHLPVDADRIAADSCRCGRVGCLQAAVSERSLLRRAAGLGIAARHVGDLQALAQQGDERLIDLFVERARLLGHAVAYLLDLFDPEVLTVMESGFLWLPPAREALLAEVAARSEIVDDPGRVVVPSSFAESPLAVAGGSVVLERVYAAPLAWPGLPTAS